MRFSLIFPFYHIKVAASGLPRWLSRGVHLPRQKTQVQFHRLQNRWARAPEPGSCTSWAQGPRLLKPAPLEPVPPDKRSPGTVTKSSPCSPQLGESPRSSEDPAQPSNTWTKLKKRESVITINIKRFSVLCFFKSGSYTIMSCTLLFKVDVIWISPQLAHRSVPHFYSCLIF